MEAGSAGDETGCTGAESVFPQGMLRGARKSGMAGEAKIVIGAEGEEGGPGDFRMGSVGAIEGGGGPERVRRAQRGKLLVELLFEGHRGDTSGLDALARRAGSKVPRGTLGAARGARGIGVEWRLSTSHRPRLGSPRPGLGRLGSPRPMHR